MAPRVLVLRSPGTNCDVETAYAFEQAGAATVRLHINRLLENPRQFNDYQILVIPGGFSYGDDLAAGRILGNQIRHHLAEELANFKAAGKLILGICNGFQVLLKSPGILLDADPAVGGLPATLTWNESGRFEDRWVNLRVVGDK
ncbi:MAG TPA: phosphoribosylformylglycinamidine synthase subunit PurQ, partial [Pirellulales bacterium]|nr:phosphoribosylformylglycinamidine synthase subunit PurQ [Pirellulales bacterium]